MKKILCLYPDIPSRHKAAGHKSAFQTIEELNKLGHQINLLSFDSTGAINSDLIKLQELCTTLIVCKIDTKQKLRNCLNHPLYPPLIASRISTDFMRLIDKIIHNIDIIHIEFSQMLFYVKYIKDKYPNKKLFFYAHDVLKQRSIREASRAFFLNPVKNLDLLITFLIETSLLEYADRVVVFNEKDAALLPSLKHKLNIIPLYTACVHPAVEIQERANNIIFFGAMNRKENYLAVIDFIKKGWPTIHDKYPDMKLLVIGGNPHDSLFVYDSVHNIKITGFVDDPYSIIATSLVTVAPIRLGAGLKVKVLESLLCGCPVVAFPAGSEGLDLDRKDGLITVPDYPEMIDEVLAIVSGKKSFDPCHVSACASAKFNWDISVEFFKQYYQ